MAVASVGLNSACVACVCFPVGLQPTCLASGRLKFCVLVTSLVMLVNHELLGRQYNLRKFGASTLSIQWLKMLCNKSQLEIAHCKGG